MLELVPNSAGWGVENAHFMSWMRLSGSADFSKLYGVIHEDLAAGSTIRVMVSNFYPKEIFQGTKHVGLKTMGSLGESSNVLAGILFATGGCCCLFGLIALVITIARGSELIAKLTDVSDPKNLQW